MTIHKKLFELKKEIGKISKDSKNPFYKSKYFDINSLLEHVEPLIEKNELLLLQPILDGAVCTQIIDIEDGTSVSSAIQLPGIDDPQKLGGCVTYYRRYTLASLLGLQAEDDDGNHASSKSVPAAARPASKAGGTARFGFVGDYNDTQIDWVSDVQINTWVSKYKEGQITGKEILEDSRNYKFSKKSQALLKELLLENKPA